MSMTESSPNPRLPSSLFTPPPVSYPNLKNTTPQKPSKLRREPNSIVDCHYVLRKVFGHTEYRGKQESIMEAAVLGADVFVLAPTGMGKVPAVADKHGITIVISPLLALMKNQVAKLRDKQVPVVAFTSETQPFEKYEIVKDLCSGHPRNRLLYITPEKLFTVDFMKLLTIIYENGELNRLVIDEAHCISEWGHDFREEYRRLGTFRERFADVPIMALTATANPTVQEDIITTLRMSPDHLFKALHPCNRSNLYYEVRYSPCPLPHIQMMDISEYITALHERKGRSSGIIYCRAKKTCDELSAFLSRKGINARPYHRGIQTTTLDKTLKEWEVGGSGNGGVDVVCATVAFGMGIDKSNVRYIIHYDLPRSFEGYYQETGRAGRNGSPAKCVLYYSREDAIRVKKWISESSAKKKRTANQVIQPSSQRADSLRALIHFAEDTETCRHISICRYFGEPIDSSDQDVAGRYCNKMCDVCKYPAKVKNRKRQLSSHEYAGTQVAQEPIHVPDEDDSRPKSEERTQERGAASREGYDAGPSLRRQAASRLMSNRTKSKRAVKETDYGGAAKKARTSHASNFTLVSSKQFNSVGVLRKPFKLPGKLGRGTAMRPLSPTRKIGSSNMGQNRSQDENDVPQGEEDVPVLSSSPVNLPEIETELELPNSHKIPSSLRQDELTVIRKALHKIFTLGTRRDHVWTRIKYTPSSDTSLNEAIITIARELEFCAYSLSTTSEGYRHRTAEKKKGVKMIEREEAWVGGDAEEWEDAREVVKVVKRVFKGTQS